MDKTPKEPNGNYRVLYVHWNPSKPYTSAKIGEDDYLHTRVWRELREERLKLDDYKCKKCGSAYNVAVHHLYYPDVWGTEDVETDLITLCENCHSRIHSKR